MPSSNFAPDDALFILHLGLGSFHRAHQAVYLHQLAQTGQTQWRLLSGNIRPEMADTLAALQRQGGAYTLETVSPFGHRHYEWITSIQRVIPYDPRHTALIDAGADSRTRIVSFTVTEAGYYLDSTDSLDAAHPDIAADLVGPSCRTIYGVVSAILRERLRRNAGPLTLLSCDNLRHNGKRFRAALLDLIARSADQRLLDWTLACTTCPNAMVDRITPRPTSDLAKRVLASTGRDDSVPVTAESFIQWVIEDDFCNGRPAWESVGVQMVNSAAPHEEAKIRILNATHSCIAWAGTLVGHRYIHESVHDERIRRMAVDFLTQDVIPALSVFGRDSPIDLFTYRDLVLDRFGNAGICDTNQRVAMDSFCKLACFVAPTIRERLHEGQGIVAAARLPALFLLFLRRWHRKDLLYTDQDQSLDLLAARMLCTSADPVATLCAQEGLWGDLAADARLVTAVRFASAEVRALLHLDHE